jgi:hypothetical protein
MSKRRGRYKQLHKLISEQQVSYVNLLCAQAALLNYSLARTLNPVVFWNTTKEISS